MTERLHGLMLPSQVHMCDTVYTHGTVRGNEDC